MFFKIGDLKNSTILEPLSNIDAGLHFQNTYGGCFWIFEVANTFFAEFGIYHHSRIGFCSGLLWKHALKQPLELFCKKRCSSKFCKFHCKTPVLKSLFNRFYQKETPTQMFSCGFTKFFNLKSATTSETCSFIWTAFFNNLHFRLKLVHML